MRIIDLLDQVKHEAAEKVICSQTREWMKARFAQLSFQYSGINFPIDRRTVLKSFSFELGQWVPVIVKCDEENNPPEVVDQRKIIIEIFPQK